MNSDASFSDTRQLVDECIRSVLEKRQLRAKELGKSYEVFWDRISEVVFAGGKRIRPYLVMVGNGSLEQRVVPIAAAQELVHIAILMHDVIDQDFVRHGKDNMSGIYKTMYGEYLDEARATHYGHGAAILAGDALLSEAYMLVSNSEFDSAVKCKITEQLQRSIYEVIGGELMDVESGFIHDQQFDPLQIYRYKTSSYSFIGPLLSGAFCANLDDEALEHLEAYATDIGIGFQIQDDLLGTFGDEEETGKSTMTDIREGKRTLLIASHEKNMSHEQRQRFDAVFANSEASDAQVQSLRDDMETTGAKDRTRQQADYYFEKAVKELDALPDDNRTRELQKFTKLLRNRSN